MRDEFATRHGDLRLMQRARELDKSMTELWDESIECEVKYHGYDEARVHPEEELVLIKENGKVVTCLPETHNVTIEGNDFEQYLDRKI
jgi:hypothetical protein